MSISKTNTGLLRQSIFTSLILSGLLSISQEIDQDKEAGMKAEMALIDGQRHLILENHAKALEMFQTALEINPENAAVSFKIAEILYHSQEYNKALEAIETALDLDPQNKFYYVLAGDIESARSDLPAAQKHYENLLKLPGTEDYLGDLALLYEYQGKYKKALATFEKVQDHFGTNEALVLEKQKLYHKIGEPEMAAKEWERLVEENPGETQFVYALVGHLVDNNSPEKAKQYLKDILDQDPSDARAGLMLAEILKRSGKSVEAMESARASLLSEDIDFKLKGGILNDFLKSNDAESSDALKKLVMEVAQIHQDDYTAQAFAGDVLFQLGYKEESISFYLKAIRITPNNFSVWQNVLSMEAEFSMWDSLIIHSEKALELFPNQGALYYFGGTGFLRKSNYKRSASLLEMGKRYTVDKKLLSVFEGQLGDAYYGLKDYKKSDAAYDASLVADPENEHVLNNYSYYLALRKQRLEKALMMSSKLIKIQPENHNYLDTHGWVLFSMGKYKEAHRQLEKAASPGNSASILEHLGDVLFKLGKETEALVQWEKAAEIGGESLLLQKKIADRKYYE